MFASGGKDRNRQWQESVSMKAGVSIMFVVSDNIIESIVAVQQTHVPGGGKKWYQRASNRTAGEEKAREDGSN